MNTPSKYKAPVAHLNDPVLWWPPALPLEHGVDVVGHGHHDRLRVPPQRLLVHVPFLCVLVDLVVIKAAEGHVSAQDDFRALVLGGGLSPGVYALSLGGRGSQDDGGRVPLYKLRLINPGAQLDGHICFTSERILTVGTDASLRYLFASQPRLAGEGQSRAWFHLSFTPSKGL